MQQRKSIYIVGGGFGGLYSALHISKSSNSLTDIYLVDPKACFVFLPLLYELVVGSAEMKEVAPLYNNLLIGSNIKRIIGMAKAVNFESKHLVIEICNDGYDKRVMTVKYDKLILAVGVRYRMDLIRGAKEYSLPLYTVSDALNIRSQLRTLMEEYGKRKSKNIKVVVIGGGYSGVEIATNLVDVLSKDMSFSTTIIDRNKDILSSSPGYIRDTARR